MFLSQIYRRLTAASLVVCAVIALAACGDDDSSGGTKDIAMVSVAGDPGFNTYKLGAEDAAENEGVNLKVGEVNDFSGDAEIQVMNSLAAANPDAMLVPALNAPTIQATLEDLADRGIEIVMYDTNAEDPEAIPAPFVASQYAELGETMGEDLAEMIGGQGTVLYLGLQPGNLALDAHQEGFYSALADYPDIEPLPVEYNDGENAKSSSIVSATLARHPDLAGVYAGLNTAGADGAYSALRQADAYPQVKVTSLDANPSGLEALEDGHTQSIGSFDLFGVGGLAVETAVKVLDGEEVPPVQELPACLITLDDVDTPESKQCFYIEAE